MRLQELYWGQRHLLRGVGNGALGPAEHIERVLGQGLLVVERAVDGIGIGIGHHGLRGHIHASRGRDQTRLLGHVGVLPLLLLMLLLLLQFWGGGGGELRRRLGTHGWLSRVGGVVGRHRLDLRGSARKDLHRLWEGLVHRQDILRAHRGEEGEGEGEKER